MRSASTKRAAAVLQRACFEPLETRRLLAASLVAAYSMDENAGTTVSDASGNANNGAAANTTWVAGKYGSGLKFTGAVGSIVTIPDKASLHLTQMTLEAWVYPTSLTSPENGWDAVVAKDHANSSNDIAYALYGAQGTNTGPAAHVLIGSADKGTGNTTTLTLNQWAFLSATYDGTTLRTYVNGVQVATKAMTGAIASTTDPLRIGGDWSGEMFTGVIDNVRVYNGALTAAQVQTDMNTPVTPPAPVAPAVTSTTPAAGATGVARNGAVSVTFNESIQPATLTLTLTDGLGHPVAGSVTYNDTTHTATLTPASPLAASTTYTATASGAKDATGAVAMAGPATWSFATAAAVLPVVTSESPTLNASNVPLTTTITATFNESIQPSTLVFSVVDSGNNAVAGSVTYNDTTHTATFTPTAALNPQSNYTVSVYGAQDLYGEPMAAPLTWSFSTQASQPSPLQVSAQTPAANATGVSVQTTIKVTFNESIQPSTLNFVLRDDKTNPIAAQSVTYDDSTHTATFTPAAPLVAGMTYNAIVSEAKDLAGNTMDHVSWVFTTQAAGTGPFSIWSPSAVPGVANDNDSSQTEVGVKFRTDAAGYITGIRFYKGTQNTGVHIGHLWTSTGQLLASATFSGETASGWQQVNFSTPVAVQANTTYVASYHTTSGHYAEDDNFFANAGVDSGPLHALKAGVDGADGVYVNSTASAAFPTNNFQSANYWVDVVFNTSNPVGPLVTSETPAQGATNVTIGTTVTATFSESVQPATISLLLRDASNRIVPGTMSYDDTTHTATFTPTATLVPSATYTATVSGAVDNSGTAMANPVSWSFTTAAKGSDPAAIGQWSSVQSFPLVAINQIVMKNGKILMFDGGPACIGSSSATVYDPTTGAFTPVPVDNSKDDNDIFCSGAVVLADGRVVVVGGHDCTGQKTGIASLNIFNPDTMTWTRGPDMAYSRWYPTATLLSDGRVLVTAGADKTDLTLVPIPEIYDPVTNKWTQLTAAKQTINNYPFMFVLPDGRILEAGSDEAALPTKVLDLSTNTWTVVDPNAVDGSSAVMYRPGMILKAGTSVPEEGEIVTNPAQATAYTLDMTSASPHWVQTQSMANARSWLDLTMLPDGTVLATGGSRKIGGADPTTAVLPAEVWNPATGTWTTMASMATPRMYHSTAVLLPDGRILVAGGGHNYINNADYYSAEYYSPAYLFKGARPTITSVNTELSYNGNFTIQTPDAANIASVSLIRNGAVTHAFDEDQRYVPLTFTVNADGTLNVQAPANANLAPPGYYMLFIVNKNGVPCVAPIVHLPVDTTPPSQPATLNATGAIGAVSLSWAASTDNVGVTAYNVYRSTTPGFTPSAANKIATTTSPSYVDSGLASGTYYYVVTAVDAVGNVSAASPQAAATSAVSPIHMVQHATTGNEASVPSLSLSTPASVNAGDFLIITGTAARPSEALTISDTAGNTFVQAVSASDSTQDVTAYVWYVTNAKGGPDTITITPVGGADALEIHVSEWSGINQMAPLDQTSTAMGTGTQITSGSATTAQAGELVFGYTFSNQNSSAGAGFTSLSPINGDQDEYQIQTLAGPTAATFTQSPSDSWFALMATFAPQPPDVTPPTPPSGLLATTISGTTIGLSWTAATDDVGVAGYNVYRSTTPGFTPSAANLITQTTGTTYQDAGLPPGTFYYQVIARDAAGNLSAPSNEANALVAGDTTPPTVALTAPANGVTVSGSVTLSANASDNVAVAGVQFYVDGVKVGSEDTTAPYTIQWNSTTVGNGKHVLTAVARDAAGNTTTSATVTVTVNNAVIPGLVASYNFDEGSGATLIDRSGDGNNGTIANATWVAGKYGGALQFNGTTSLVTVANSASLNLTAGMTLEAWIDPTSLASPSAGWDAVIAKEHINSSNDISYALYAGQGANTPPGGHILVGSQDYGTTGGSVLPLNQWAFLAVTFDGTTLRTYLNGVQISTKTVSGKIATTTDPLTIGGDWDNEMFTGLIDNIRIYNTALSTTQLQTDMTTAV